MLTTVMCVSGRGTVPCAVHRQNQTGNVISGLRPGIWYLTTRKSYLTRSRLLCDLSVKCERLLQLHGSAIHRYGSSEYFLVLLGMYL